MCFNAYVLLVYGLGGAFTASLLRKKCIFRCMPILSAIFWPIMALLVIFHCASELVEEVRVLKMDFETLRRQGDSYSERFGAYKIEQKLIVDLLEMKINKLRGSRK